MQPASRATLTALLAGLALAAPAAVLAAPAPEDAPTAIEAGADDDPTDAGSEDATDGTPDDDLAADAPAVAPAAADPFCPDDAEAAGEDADDVDSDYDEGDAEEAEPSTDATPGDVLNADGVTDEPVAASGRAIDFCQGTPVAAAALSRSLATVRKRVTVTPGTLSLAVPGTVVRELRLTRDATRKALRRYRATTLGTASRVAATDGLVELPVKLNAKGRKALRAAGRRVSLTVTTTQRLASGQHRTRTQVVVLRR